MAVSEAAQILAKPSTPLTAMFPEQRPEKPINTCKQPSDAKSAFEVWFLDRVVSRRALFSLHVCNR